MQLNVAEKRPLRLLNRNFFLLWQGQTISQLGNQAFSIAMALWIKQATGSATLMGLILMLASLPAVLLGPIGGTISDRYPRRTIIIVCDVVAGVAVLSLAGLMTAVPDAVNLIVGWLAVVAVLLAVIGSFFNPAISAAIPDLVPPERVGSANSLAQFSFQLTIFIGQAIGGTLFRLLGAPVLFLLDGLTYLFSAGSESFITIPQTMPEKSQGWRESWRAFGADLRAGLRYVWQRAGLRELVLASALLNFFLAPVILLLPFYVEDFLQATPDWYGFLLAAYGLGAMLGFVAAGAAPLSGRMRARLMLLFIVIEPLGYGALGLVNQPVAALALVLLGGALSGFVTINVTTLLQITTPSEVRGRVFGLLAAISGALTPLAMGLGGVAADLTQQNIPLIYLICGLAAAALTTLIALNRDFRAYLASEPEPAVKS